MTVSSSQRPDSMGGGIVRRAGPQCVDATTGIGRGQPGCGFVCGVLSVVEAAELITGRCPTSTECQAEAGSRSARMASRTESASQRA